MSIEVNEIGKSRGVKIGASGLEREQRQLSIYR